MQAILGAFWQIALLRQGPEDLPDSQFLFAFAALLYIGVDMLVIVALYPAQSYVQLLLADVLLLGAWATGLLAVFSLLSRARRTLTALLGAGALLQVLVLPLSLLPALLPQVIRILLLVLVLLWSVAVYGNILARALSRSFGIGIAFAVVYFILSYEMVGQLIPAN
ncbi:MAG: hypothetical protein CL799_01815 [Chromatiales bacterium]|jgi:hypothetical protein|nr:hypothetical protein [Chromatiales bacterium]MDP6150876.1 hypothetical protein [Gammaproteobacteria bacterium]MDP7270555.1 hypothetical protein [Gammaproteobacteria bacterium]HJP04829.1 hypothetical protein [Gammaproteobacteria bacterium]